MADGLSGGNPQVTISSSDVGEGQNPGAEVGTLSVTGAPADEVFTYELLDLADSGLFSLSGKTLTTNSVLVATDAATRAVVVRATGTLTGSIDRLVEVVVRPVTGFFRWRLDHFTVEKLNNPALETSVWGDHADDDGDGLTTRNEYAADTNPRDLTSRYGIELRRIGAGAELSWSAGTASQQVLESSDTLELDSWQVLETLVPPTPVNSLRLIAEDRVRRFIRIRFVRL
jgi:hypothetical protein